MMPMVRPCPVCGGMEATPIHVNEMAPLDGLDMSYRVARCRRCGFSFADRLPPISQYDDYYRWLSKYDSANNSSGMSGTDEIRCAAAVGMLRGALPTDAAIADLGCGSGVLLAALRDAGWSRLAGIDPAPAAPREALARFGIDCVRSGRLEQAPSLLPLDGFDAVCLTGVLEHLPDLRRNLEALIASLSDRARILVEVPALERFASRPGEPFGEFSLEHIQYFSTSSLIRFFATLGFSPLATLIVELPRGSCDSLFGLFARTSRPEPSPADADLADGLLEDYVARCAHGMADCLAKISDCDADSFVIYGAGSHTARLLPRLTDAVRKRIACIVDRNPNLHGKRLGGFAIETQEALAGHASATVVVSTFGGQEAIVGMLRTTRPNPVLALY